MLLLRCSLTRPKAIPLPVGPHPEIHARSGEIPTASFAICPTTLYLVRRYVEGLRAAYAEDGGLHMGVQTRSAPPYVGVTGIGVNGGACVRVHYIGGVYTARVEILTWLQGEL